MVGNIAAWRRGPGRLSWKKFRSSRFRHNHECEFSSLNGRFPLESSRRGKSLNAASSDSLRRGHEIGTNGKISESSGDRRWGDERQAAGDGAKRAAKISVRPNDDAGKDGSVSEEGRGGLEVRLHLARLSRADHQWASASRASQPGARLGGIQLSKSVWLSGENHQRCGH